MAYGLERTEEGFGQILAGEDLRKGHRPVALGWGAQLVLPEEVVRLPVLHIFVGSLDRLVALLQHVTVPAGNTLL